MTPPTGKRGDTYQVIVAGSFTAQPIESAIEFWADELSLQVDLAFTPYDQIFQQLLSAESSMAKNIRGINVLLLRVADLVRTGEADLRQAAVDLADAVRDAATRWTVPALIVVCPRSPVATQATGTDDVERELVRDLRHTPAVHVLDPADLAAWYPDSLATDEYADMLGHVPYSTTAFVAIGTAIVRHIYRVLTPEPKVIVADADHTLWDGVAGEGELADIRIGPSRQAIQHILLDQRQAGRLLCLCSKNSEADTLAVMDRHQHMRLSVQDFSAVRVNWRPKSANLAELAEELGLGLDSFVFIDDSPVECAEVRARWPEMVVLELPADAADAERFLRHCWILDIGTTTPEDALRAGLYHTAAERDRVRRTAPDLATFLDSLALRVHMGQPEPEDIPRIAQLTQRTNQFNLTTRKRTEVEVRKLLETKDCLVVTAEDRFGPYGLVGVVIFETADAGIRVETFLLSCRALGRGIEHRVLAHVGRLARQRGLNKVELEYRSTRRNRPAAEFVRLMCGIAADDELDDGRYTLSVVAAAAATYVPEASGPAELPSPRADGGYHDAGLGRALWQLGNRTSPWLTTVRQIEERMRRRGRAAAEPDSRAHDSVPASVDDAVEVIMADVLDRPSVGHDENFFELGGSSLQLVRFMSKIREHFNVELPVDTLYNSELTVRDISASILLQSMGELDEVSKVIALVESMTDEQVDSILGALDSTQSRSID